MWNSVSAVPSPPPPPSSSPLAGTGRRGEQASSLMQVRGQQTSASPSPSSSGGEEVSHGRHGDRAVAGQGRLNNAAEFAVTKLDDLVNWGRKVI